MSDNKLTIQQIIFKVIEAGKVQPLEKMLDILTKEDNKKVIITQEMLDMSLKYPDVFEVVNKRFYYPEYISIMMTIIQSKSVRALTEHLSTKLFPLPLSDDILDAVNCEMLNVILDKAKPLNECERKMIDRYAQRCSADCLEVLTEEFDIKLDVTLAMCKDVDTLRYMLRNNIVTLESLYEFSKQVNEVNILKNIFSNEIGLDIKFEDEIILKRAAKNRNWEVTEWYLETIDFKV